VIEQSQIIITLERIIEFPILTVTSLSKHHKQNENCLENNNRAVARYIKNFLEQFAITNAFVNRSRHNVAAS
ncbi:13933_t:CDS:1, partial [Entrophospora sp. SA101]